MENQSIKSNSLSILADCAGFIGANLCELLLKEGQFIAAINSTVGWKPNSFANEFRIIFESH